VYERVEVGISEDKKRKGWPCKGFTLMEMLIVILLSAIFLSLAAVNWNGLLPRGKETFLETFSIEIAFLKEEAVARYDDRVMEFDLSGNTINVGRIDAVKGYVPLKELPVPEGYRLRDVLINGQKVSLGKPLIRFYSTGLIDRTIVHLDREGSDPYSIMVDPLTARITGKNGYIEEVSVPKGNKSS
jgi:prepilin-type N-terminal cleavage/methylation domain-containing protein